MPFTTTISEAFAIAIEHHRSGRLQAAEQIYRQILQVDPNQAKAYHLLGVIAHQVGKRQIAVDCIGRAIALKGNDAEFHFSLGIAYVGLAQLSAGAASYRRAIELNPSNAGAHNNLGLILKEQGDLDAAIVCLRRAVALQPNSAEAHHNLGVAWQEMRRLEDAIACFQRALAIRPNSGEIHNSLTSVLWEQDRVEEALAFCRRALELEPDSLRARGNLAILCFMTGRYEEGWREFERHRQGAGLARPYSTPQWKGETAPGRAILIYTAEGAGDMFQFLRYALLARQRSGAERIILEAGPAVARLLAQNLGPGFEIVLPPYPEAGAPHHFQSQAALAGLPVALGQFEPLPMAAPYLRADPSLRLIWRNRLGPASALRVGLVWAGDPINVVDRQRTISADAFLPLLRIPGFQYYSLQVGPTAKAPALTEAGLIDLTAHISDFAETAALIAELDLIITVDTAVAHLAGAMGRPVWTLLPVPPDWRWGRSGAVTPWYPTMRLFRQAERGDWPSVIARIARALAELAG